MSINKKLNRFDIHILVVMAGAMVGSAAVLLLSGIGKKILGDADGESYVVIASFSVALWLFVLWMFWRRASTPYLVEVGSEAPDQSSGLPYEHELKRDLHFVF
jgi:ABC-type siderophore export system fused ATPase/permease subunit